MIEGELAAFAAAALAKGAAVARVSVVAAEGSTPREAGATMLVSGEAVAGTIGGGRLELDAITAARRCLAGAEPFGERTVVLGPAIGQCCGGRVRLAITPLADLRAAEALEAAALRSVLVFGAGHVGAALARALAPLPLRVRLLDPRPEMIRRLAIPGVALVRCSRLTDEVAAAPAGSAVVVMTHSHALDSLVTAAALARPDLAYVGLIGSATKRRTFARAFRRLGMAEAAIARLVCPIGAGRVRDKRPAVIAALVAAEILEADAATAAQAGAPGPRAVA
jgi:xanthine dehydrogenase accessory factor/xanthine dehydrogenase large subunit